VSVRRCRCQVQVFERALDLPDQVDGNAGIARRRLDVPMPEQVLDDANVDALFKQVCRKTVSQRVDRDRLAQPGGLGRAPAGQLQRPLGHRPDTVAARTRIVSAAGIRLDPWKSVRPFKGIFCYDVSEFEYYMPSQAVVSAL